MRLQILIASLLTCALWIFIVLAKTKKSVLNKGEAQVLKTLCQPLIVSPVKGQPMICQEQVGKALEKTEEGRELAQKYGLGKLTDKVRYLIKSRPFKE